ncbi:hypothetical protein [Halorubellus sp. PRR65]|uniref:hypothetical protein n=1 Tax=Halorubellus sp. PRR65 TaxID=3098148 RepID=UPI002B2597DF|nr:hypothetical protein [Halorubellus sp. PRR65]
MEMGRGFATRAREHLRPAAAFSLGAVLAGFAALTFWQHAFLSVQRDAATSTDAVGVTFVLGYFVAGVVLMYVSTMASLERTRR